MNWSDRAITSMSDEDLDRFLTKVEFSGECWEWKAYRNEKGYGQFRLGFTTVRSNRIACWLRHDAPPEECSTVDHLCKNASCVNPDHLRWVSEVHASVRLDDHVVVEVIKSYLKGEHSQSSLARKFDVSPNAVHHWVKGRNRPELLKRAREELAA